MRWPWVSREMYDAVVAAKDQSIALLEAQNAVLAVRCEQPIPVNLKLDMPTVQIPAVTGRRPRNGAEQDRPKPKPIDYATLNENDHERIAELAAEEFGYIPPPFVLARWQNQLVSQIRQAKARNLVNAMRSGRVGAVEAPKTEAEAVDQGPEYVPSHVRELIESAESAARS